jgi:hypothetical protein
MRQRRAELGGRHRLPVGKRGDHIKSISHWSSPTPHSAPRSFALAHFAWTRMLTSPRRAAPSSESSALRNCSSSSSKPGAHGLNGQVAG